MEQNDDSESSGSFGAGVPTWLPVHRRKGHPNCDAMEMTYNAIIDVFAVDRSEEATAGEFPGHDCDGSPARGQKAMGGKKGSKDGIQVIFVYLVAMSRPMVSLPSKVLFLLRSKNGRVGVSVRARMTSRFSGLLPLFPLNEVHSHPPAGPVP